MFADLRRVASFRHIASAMMLQQEGTSNDNPDHYFICNEGVTDCYIYDSFGKILTRCVD